MKVAKLIFILLSILSLNACGGGGGGGSSKGGSSGSNASSGLRLLHAAIDTAPLSYVSSLDQAQSDLVRFAGVSFYKNAKDEAQTLSVVKALSASSVELNISAEAGLGDKRTLLIYGSSLSHNLRGTLLSDSFGDIADGKSKLRIVNGLQGAATLSSTISGGSLSANFGSSSDYAELDSGVVSVSLKKGAATVAELSPTLLSGKAYTVLVTGQTGYLVLTPLYEDN